jgi:hypothetical protein
LRVRVHQRIGVLAIAAVGGLTVASAASAANTNEVSRGLTSPVGAGSMSRPLPIGVQFGLRSRAENPRLRPLPTKTYVLSMEGVTANAKAFPACGLAKLKRRKGPPARCAGAQLGTGLVKGAAGIVEDDTIAESVPCNLKLRVYNIGNGIALRLDGDPPLPAGFKSNKIGCPVPIHTAIPAPFRRVTIDGLPSTEMQFTVPKVLAHPLEGWNSALTLVNVDLERRTTQVRVGGAKRTVGYFSAVGCTGGERSLQVGFIGTDGVRSEASATPAC